MKKFFSFVKITKGKNLFATTHLHDNLRLEMKSDFLIKLRNTLLLGASSTLLSFIYLDHQVKHSWRTLLERDFATPQSANSLFLGEFGLAALAVFICAGVGFFLSARYRLPGMGGILELKKVYPYLFFLSIPLMFIAYGLHDRVFIEGAKNGKIPLMLPESAKWALIFLLYSVFFKETVLRFGLVTLANGFFRGNHPLRAVGVVAVFSAGLGLRELGFAGMTPTYNLTTIGVFLWALLYNFCLGVAFVRKGLLASMLLRAFVESRTIIFVMTDIT